MNLFPADRMQTSFCGKIYLKYSFKVLFFFSKNLALLVSFKWEKNKLTASPSLKNLVLIILRTYMMITQKNPEGTIDFCLPWSSKTQGHYFVLCVLWYPENEGIWYRTKVKLLKLRISFIHTKKKNSAKFDKTFRSLLGFFPSEK